ncbi:hypothetical protein KPATCC21470_8652 [Kitasatospora purpeofusca]
MRSSRPRGGGVPQWRAQEGGRPVSVGPVGWWVGQVHQLSRRRCLVLGVRPAPFLALRGDATDPDEAWTAPGDTV